MYKYFVWCSGLSCYWPSTLSFYNLALIHNYPCFKLPLFGYHSNTHSGFSLSALRVPHSEARRPEK